jgi:hypothetical protein
MDGALADDDQVVAYTMGLHRLVDVRLVRCPHVACDSVCKKLQSS